MFQSSNISPRCLTAWHTYWKIWKSLKQEQTSSHYPQYKPVKGPPVLPGLAQVPCLPLKIHLSSRPSDNLHTALHPEQREQKEQGESRGRARRWSGWAEFRIVDLQGLRELRSESYCFFLPKYENYGLFNPTRGSPDVVHLIKWAF